MTNKESEWKSTALASAFLQGVRGAIPAADLQFDLLIRIVNAWNSEPKTILDLGCGDGIIGRLFLDRFPNVNVVFADFSSPMLDAAGKYLKGCSRASLVELDFSTNQWLETVQGIFPFDVVVSGFSIHHQPNTRKKEIYSEVYNILSESGSFLNLEHVASATGNIEMLFDNYFVDHLFSYHHKTDDKISRIEIEKSYYLRPDKKENILTPVEVQCDWLRQIGFKDVDCFFKVFELALFGGRRSPNNL